MIEYALYFRRFGIRRIEQLVKPVLWSINKLFLPFNSAVHYFSDEPGAIGMMPDDPLLNQYKKVLMVNHITELSLKEGPPIPMMVPLQKYLMPYQRAFKRSRAVKDLVKSISDERSILQMNYSLLPYLYRYQETNPFTPYRKWHNVYATMWEHAEELAKISNRNQFFVMELPTVLPPMSMLIKAEEKFTPTMMHYFNTPELLTVLDVWTWLGKYRENATMNKLDIKHYANVNIIWMHAGRWTVMNLGVMNGWIKQGDHPIPTAIDPLQMQKRFLRMLMSISEAATVGGVEDEDDTDVSETHQSDDGSLKEAVGKIPTDLNKLPADQKPILDAREGSKPQAAAQSVMAAGKGTKQKSKVETDHSPDMIDTSKDGRSGQSSVDDVDGAIIDMSLDKVDKDLEQLEKIHEINQGSNQPIIDYKPYTPPKENLEAGVMASANNLAKKGLLSGAEYRRIERLSTRYKEIPDPFGGKGKLADLTVIKPEETKINETTPLAENIPGVLDKSMLSSSLKVFDQQYVKEVMHKDVVSMVMNLQKAGIAVQNYDVEHVEDYTDSFLIHTVKVVPVIGSPTTLKFRTPKIDEDDTFKAGGVKYRMRKQRGQLPICKISIDTVALTSYYSKLFVQRSARAVFNYPNWLVNNIVSRAIDPDDQSVTDIKMAYVFDSDVVLPRVYTSMATRVSEFTCGPLHFTFNYSKQNEFFGEAIAKEMDVLQNKFVLCGKSGENLLVMDYNNIIYSVVPKDAKGSTQKIGTLEEIVGIPTESRPIEIVEVGVFAKAVPIAFVLGHEVGLGSLLKTLNIIPRRVPRNERINLQPEEFAVRFNDESLVFDRNDQMAQFIFGSFNRFHRDIKRYSVYSFDKKEVYQTILDNNSMGARFVREFDLMFKMWVDHITKELLEEMKEPTDLVNLFISACRKLMTDQHPQAIDNSQMRDKGYERVSGMLYGELVKALRVYNAKPANATATMDLNPQAVWQVMLQDPTVSPVEESNPIHSLKEKEVVVYRGQGGRSARSMTADARIYHKSGLGVVSEATTDNSDVATVTLLTADPNYTSVRGTVRQLKTLDGNATKLVSTSFLMAPGAEMDHMRRSNFISIQNSASIACAGYTPVPMRTGYERVLAQRTDDLYAKAADEDGTVEEVTDKAIVITYKSGKKVSYELGRRYGKKAGDVLPHEVATKLEAGKSFKKGAILCYNTSYFTPDNLDPNQVMYKPGVMCRTALMESTDTLEDSSAISETFAKKLATSMTNIRTVKVAFDQDVLNTLKVGSEVDIESILCTIANPQAGKSDLFDEEALDTLKAISSLTPHAKHPGVIEKIEVLYVGELDDMSKSLQALTDDSDRSMIRLSKKLGKSPIVGRVEVGFRVDGIPMEMDSVAIRFYITGSVGCGVGDKIVFANQLKSVVGRRMSGRNESVDGKPIEGIYGYQSLANRTLLSAEKIGTTNTLLIALGDLATAAYRKE